MSVCCIFEDVRYRVNRSAHQALRRTLVPQLTNEIFGIVGAFIPVPSVLALGNACTERAFQNRAENGKPVGGAEDMREWSDIALFRGAMSNQRAHPCAP